MEPRKNTLPQLVETKSDKRATTSDGRRFTGHLRLGVKESVHRPGAVKLGGARGSFPRRRESPPKAHPGLHPSSQSTESRASLGIPATCDQASFATDCWRAGHSWSQ